MPITQKLLSWLRWLASRCQRCGRLGAITYRQRTHYCNDVSNIVTPMLMLQEGKRRILG